MEHHHRSSTKKNRSFKGQKNTADKKGKTGDHAPGPLKPEVVSRINRKNQAKQQRQHKRESHLLQLRGATGIAPPRQVALIGASPDATLDELKFSMLSKCRFVGGSSMDMTGPITADLGYEKQRATFISVPRDLDSTVDAVSVADIVLWVVRAGSDIDASAEFFQSVSRMQGLPTVIVVIQGLGGLPQARKAQEKKKWLAYAYANFGTETKVHSDEDDKEVSQLLRTVTSVKCKRASHREDRPSVLISSAEISDNNDGTASVKLTGYLRGKAMSADQLVHFPGVGTFQIDQILGVTDPCPLQGGSRGGTSRRHSIAGAMTDDVPSDVSGYCVALSVATEARESIDVVREVDPMAGEQTWPTEEDEEMAEGTRRKKKHPKGMSSYQASWLIEEGEDEGEEEEGEGEGFGDADEEDLPAAKDGEESGDEMEEQSDVESEGESDIENDSDEESPDKMKADWEGKNALRAAATENQKFPDEVDTPLDVPARIRFQKYRGLKSLRTSPWDPKESLPLDYAKIFQFQNFNWSKKCAFRSPTTNSAEVGRYVTLSLSRLPLAAASLLDPKNRIVVAGGLLKHENRMSVMHFLLHRLGSRGEIIKNKDELVFYVGWRRFSARPIFSEHSLKSDKFRQYRFFQEGTGAVASCYCPITFAPAPVTVFRRLPSGALVLAANGHILGADPDRIILKRIILTGHPLKIKKRRCVARWMFFNADDIKYYRKIELRTKHGKRGHIRESVGTHGRMKCIFDKPINQQDTICLNLYKRVFPKWPVGV